MALVLRDDHEFVRRSRERVAARRVGFARVSLRGDGRSRRRQQQQQQHRASVETTEVTARGGPNGDQLIGLGRAAATGRETDGWPIGVRIGSSGDGGGGGGGGGYGDGVVVRLPVRGETHGRPVRVCTHRTVRRGVRNVHGSPAAQPRVSFGYIFSIRASLRTSFLLALSRAS